MIIDIFTKEEIKNNEKKPQVLTVGNIVTYLNSFGQDLKNVLEFPVITENTNAKTVELTPEGLVIK